MSETPGAGICLRAEWAVGSTWREPPGHKGNAKGHLALQLHRGMVCCHQSWWLLVLSNASVLPSEIQLTLHTITSPGTHSGGNFGYGQSLLLPAYINRKGHWPDIIQDKGKRWGKKKIVHFVGSVSRKKSFQLLPSGALHPTAFKQACSAASMSFTRSGVLGRAVVYPPPQCSAQQLVGGSSLYIKDVVCLWIIFHRTLKSDELKAFIRKTRVTMTKPAKNKTQETNHSGTRASRHLITK